MNDVAYMVSGAALVTVGVLAAALADRIRDLRFVRERAPALREPAPQAAHTRTGEAIELPIRSRGPRVESRLDHVAADEVIAALVASGHKKPVATDAVHACSEAERATIETWTRAALRRSRGALS